MTKKKRRPPRVPPTRLRPEGPKAPKDAEPPTKVIHAVSFETRALQEPLRFPPPMFALARDPQSFEYQWHLIQFVFGVSDPRGFPPFSEPFSGEEVRVLRRYVSHAESLAASSILGWHGGMRISWDDKSDAVNVETFKPPADAETGFAAMLRQFWRHNHDASFAKVHRMLYEKASKATDDSADARLHELHEWAAAVRKTRRQSLKKSVFLELIERGEETATPEELETFPDRMPLDTLIERALYTQYLHWDSKRAEEIELSARDPVTEASDWFDFLDGALGLAHLYIGHAELVRRAAGLQPSEATTS